MGAPPAACAPGGDARLSLAIVLVLYNSQISGNCYKVRLLLAHLGIPYERREVDVRRPVGLAPSCSAS